MIAICLHSSPFLTGTFTVDILSLFHYYSSRDGRYKITGLWSKKIYMHKCRNSNEVLDFKPVIERNSWGSFLEERINKFYMQKGKKSVIVIKRSDCRRLYYFSLFTTPILTRGLYKPSHWSITCLYLQEKEYFYLCLSDSEPSLVTCFGSHEALHT